MAENVLQPVEVPVPLQLFGGLVTEMSPSDLPEGISPDCRDIAFFPGGIASRAAAQSWLTGLLPANTTVTYQKTFTTPSGATKNLILTSDGQFFVQDSATPNVLTKLCNVTPGSYASSVSAFGKELIVFHDTVQGTDIPRIYDGNFFDRATQDGPGAPPSVSNLIIPDSQLDPSSAPAPVAITGITTSDFIRLSPHGFFFFSTITITCASTAGLFIGQGLTIAGNTEAAFNTTWAVSSVISSTVFKCAANFATAHAGTGGTYTVNGGATLVRSNNTVQAQTATPHGLSVGFQAQISGVPDEDIGGGIVNIVVDNETEPGVATVTTNDPHGLLPENLVSILGVTNTAIGGGIASISRSAQVVLVETNTDHGLSQGAVVVIGGVTDNTYNGQFIVTAVISPTQFTYAQVDADGTSTGGTVEIVWPVSNTSIIQNFFTVLSAPTPTTFQVQLFYNSGTWTGGTVTFQWNGIFYVTSVVSDVSFNYQQYGPNATTSQVGTVTPHSQIQPGLRSCVVMFQLRTGLITAPSPPIQFVSNGGQYLSINNIPIPPANAIARILAFTGADGNNFFYIAQPAFVNGITISTSTVVNDITSTSVVVDFSDLTLFDSIGIDIPGNNLFELGVLGPCLGVASYASRAAWYGMKNAVPNLFNLGFDGGYYTDLHFPLGWDVVGANGILDAASANSGYAWLIQTEGNANDGQITQPAFRDPYNVSILQPSTKYSVDLKLKLVFVGGIAPFIGNIVVDIYTPATTTVLASVSFPVADIPADGSFFWGDMNATLPAVIPADTIIRVYYNNGGIGTKIAIDDIEIYPTLQPDTKTFLFSYVNLPDSIDLETGVLGATDDDTPIQCHFTYRDAFLFLTRFGLHETTDLANYEPSNWEVREVSRNCGACGPKAVTTGENFSAWVTSPSTQPPVGRGLYLYTGGAVYKLSQEIQPDFDSVNAAAQTTIWLTNDAVTRRMYMGLPMGSDTAPGLIYVLDYREMDTASEIASKSPIHISFTGKMICSDLSRKWTKWSLAANCAEIMNIPGIGVQFSIGCGNGQTPQEGSGFADCFWFNDEKFTDDHYGMIVPYYYTYFFINHEMEQQIQVGVHRKLYKRYALFIQGLGKIQIGPYGDNLSNPWPLTEALTMSDNPTFDLGDGINVIAERCSFKISSSPLTGQTDNWFTLGKFIVTLQQEPVAPIRFGAI